MSTSSGRGIVVAADGSEPSDAAVRWATHSAAMRKIPLTIIHVMSMFAATWPESPRVEEFALAREFAGRQVLDDALKIAHDSTSGVQSLDIDTELYFGRPAPTLIDLSKQADLIVVGNRGRGALARNIFGSVSTSVLRQAHCPVAVIRAETSQRVDPAEAPVLLGTDGSPASDHATAIAFDEASRRRVDLMAVHAWSDIIIEQFPALDWAVVKADEQKWMDENLGRWQQLHPDVVVHKHLVCDRPARAIIAKARSAQLVVLGNHGRGKVARTLLGSVSNAVTQAVQVPIIVARR